MDHCALKHSILAPPSAHISSLSSAGKENGLLHGLCFVLFFFSFLYPQPLLLVYPSLCSCLHFIKTDSINIGFIASPSSCFFFCLIFCFVLFFNAMDLFHIEHFQPVISIGFGDINKLSELS